MSPDPAVPDRRSLPLMSLPSDARQPQGSDTTYQDRPHVKTIPQGNRHLGYPAPVATSTELRDWLAGIPIRPRSSS